MSLINPAILYGALLAIVPIVLHLLLRSKPKRVVFPALRLVQVRRRQNVRRLQLRHFWLLLLRVGLILLLVFALARPTLPPANYSLTAREWLTGLVVLAAAVAAYGWTLRRWRRRGLPGHTLRYRKTFLRAAVSAATVFLLALLVAWPYKRRIAAEISSPAPVASERVPVAAVFLFDTSLSMAYRQQNRTRLEQARAIAVEHLNRLPSGSRVAVADTSTTGPLIFQADLTSARSRVDSLNVSAWASPLETRLLDALDLLQEDRRRSLSGAGTAAGGRDPFVREVYVFTDLARHAWPAEQSKTLARRLKDLPWVSLYLIDVGVDRPVNVGLGPVRLSEESLPSGGRLSVQTSVFSVGLPQQQRTVELFVQDGAGRLLKLGQDVVAVGPGEAAQVEFAVDGLKGPLCRGEIRLDSSDPFAPDDVRYFTVRVRQPPNVLLVAPTPAQARLLQLALAPTELARLGRARYRCQYASPEQLVGKDLSRFGVVCLVSVPRLSGSAWRALDTFVRAGGGLAVFLGTHGVETAVSYNSPEAQRVLPAELLASLRFRPPEFLDLQTLTHPLFRKFERLGGAAELASQEVRRFWRVRPHPDAAVVVRFTDPEGSPAFVEASRGEGRVVLVTTTVDLRGWSDLPRAGWQWVAFADQLAAYLAHATAARFNYRVGERAEVPIDPGVPARRYLVRTPALGQVVRPVEPGARKLVVEELTQVGHYEVVPAAQGFDFRTGFSVNGPEAESDFRRLRPADLDALFGKGRYALARDIQALTRRVSTGRLGVEVLPILFVLLVAFFLAEQVVSNWFYDEPVGAQEQGPSVGLTGGSSQTQTGARPTLSSALN